MKVVQLAQCLTGLTLLYIALFLYENEEGHLQNILEKWWIHVDDHRKEYARLFLVLLQFLATKISFVLDRLFGRTLLSTQAAAVSLCLFIGTITLTMIVTSMFGVLFVDLDEASFFESLSNIFLFFLLPLLLIYFLIRIVRDITHAPPAQWFLKLTIVLFACVAFYAASIVVLRFSDVSQSEISSDVIVFSIGASLFVFLASYASDVFLIALSRLTLRRVMGATSLVTAAATVIATNVGVYVISMCPLALILNEKFRGLYGRNFHFDTVVSILLVVLSNIPALVASTLLSGLALLMLMHRVVWPIVQRPVYMIARFELLKKKKVVGGLGVAFVVLAFPEIAIWLGGPLGRALLPTSILKGVGVP